MERWIDSAALLIPRIHCDKWHSKEGRSPGVATRAGTVGLMVGNGGGIRAELRDAFDLRRRFHRFAQLLHMATPLGESADDELLSKAGADPFCGADCKIPKDKANAPIRPRKIEI